MEGFVGWLFRWLGYLGGKSPKDIPFLFFLYRVQTVTHHGIHSLTCTEAPRGFWAVLGQNAKKGPYGRAVFFYLSRRFFDSKSDI